MTRVEDPGEDTIVLFFSDRICLSISIAAQHSVDFLLFMLPLLMGHRKDRDIRCGALEKFRMRFGGRFAFAVLFDVQFAFNCRLRCCLTSG